MRQDKDRTGKWLLNHHADSVLRLGGITGFTSWKALQPETVAPRRSPDGLIEVHFPGVEEPRLVLVEIETYPDSEVARQIFDDIMLMLLERKVVPEVVSLVLKPKGHLTVSGNLERASAGGGTRITGSWPVVRMWELEAETLLAANDVGLIPWVPLTKTTMEPEELLIRCRDRLATVNDADDRGALLVATQLLARLAFPGPRFWNFFMGVEVMIESPVFDDVKAILRERYETEATLRTLRKSVLANLEARFGSVPEERIAVLNTLTDEPRLEALHRFAATCPNLDAFVAELTATK